MSVSFYSKLVSIIFTLVLVTSCSSKDEINLSNPSPFEQEVINTNDQTPTTESTMESTSAPSSTIPKNSITPSSGTPTLCLGFEPTPTGTPPPWINGSSLWEQMPTALLPIQDNECVSPNDLVNQLVDQWLHNIEVDAPNLPCGLEDYKVDTITIKPNTLTPQYEIVAIVEYEVNPGRFTDCSWLSDRGFILENGWIKTHDPFGVYRKDGYYQLIVLPGWGS